MPKSLFSHNGREKLVKGEHQNLLFSTEYTFSRLKFHAFTIEYNSLSYKQIW